MVRKESHNDSPKKSKSRTIPKGTTRNGRHDVGEVSKARGAKKPVTDTKEKKVHPEMNKPDLSLQQLIRKERLQELVDNDYGGVARRLAEKINKSDSYVRNLLNGRKGMGEKVAREIEKALNLYAGYLDTPPDKQSAVFIFELLKDLNPEHFDIIKRLCTALRDGKSAEVLRLVGTVSKRV